MLRNYIRVLYSDNGALTDISNKLQDDSGYVTPLTKDEDYIYIGQMMPFNNFFALMEVINDVAATLSLEYWSQNEWRPVVDILDSSEGFTKTGCIQFTPDKDYSWECIDDTSEVSNSFELKTKKIYNLYWIRVKSSATLKATTKVSKLAYAFCHTNDLKKSYSEINNYFKAVGGSTKADWYPEIIDASEQVVTDLKGKGLVVHPGQVLLFDDVSYATRHKVCINLFSNFGEAFADKLAASEKEYRNALSIKRFTLDVNKNASIEKVEQFNSVGVLER